MDSREIAFDILKNIEENDAYVGDVLGNALRRMQFSSKQERSFITRLVEGSVERKLTLDFLIDKFSNKKGGKQASSSKKLPLDIRIILRMGIYQIRYMDSVPDRAAISEMVEMAKSKGYSGLAGYINALLRNVSRAVEEKKLDSFTVSKQETRYSTPAWLCTFLNETYGKENAKLILEDQFSEHDTVIRVNRLKISVEELKGKLSAKGINVKEPAIYDGSLRISGYDQITRIPGYKDGNFIVQDETSSFTVSRAGIRPGDTVLDMCASPGGKSLLAYELAFSDEKCGKIISRDISDSKLEKIKENAERLGFPLIELEKTKKIQPGINVEVWDATELDERIASLPNSEKPDVVIADVPCSGLGIIGRKNDIKYHTSLSAMQELAEQGLKILQNAAAYVKTGGRICYSTCTINPGENGEVVRKFLEKQKEDGKRQFEIVEEKTFLQGIDGSDGFYYCILS